mmetsp:Transcript_23002/g.38861  ORF Transcript_23002/g.38861 Transcript_23002/m.38861 type:complete len:272 (-) Transcript_23002:4686-5501(-)
MPFRAPCRGGLSVVAVRDTAFHQVFVHRGLGRCGDRLAVVVGQIFDLFILGQPHSDLAVGKVNALAFKEFADFLVDLFADQPLIAGLGHELDPDDHGAVLHLDHALGLEGLDEVFANHRVVQQFHPKLFDQLTDLFHVGVIGHAQGQFHDHPVAGIVGQDLNFAKGHGVQRAEVMTQLETADADLFDRPFDTADIDIFTAPKCIIEQEERARKDIAHKALAAKAHRNAHDPRTGKEGADVDPHFHQGDQEDRDHDDHKDEVAKERQERRQT